MQTHKDITDSTTLIDQAHRKLLTLTHVSYQLHNDEHFLCTNNMPINRIYAHVFFSQNLLRVWERTHVTGFICPTERMQHDAVRGPLDWHQGKSTTRNNHSRFTIYPLLNSKVWSPCIVQ